MSDLSTNMHIALVLLIIQGVLGAWDTLFYHEWKTNLPRNVLAKGELKLHALRSFIYGVIFSSIAFVQYLGIYVWILVVMLVAEIIITMMDFIEEDSFRKLDHGERIGHAIMGIVYGGFLAFFIPEMIDWSEQSTGFSGIEYGIYSLLLLLMGAGVTLSAIRDLLASRGIVIISFPERENQEPVK